MARTELPNGVILPAEYSDDWYEDMTSNLTKLDDVIGSDSEKLNSNDVAFLRMSSAALTDGGTGNFSDLNSSNKLKTGDYVLDSGRKLYQVVSVDSTNETFTVGNSLFKITAESDLAPVAESGDYGDLDNRPDLKPVATSGDYDDLDNKPNLNPYDQHLANTDIHVTAADKQKWNDNVNQSYVLRYASTSVTPSSTIAYSVLNNTDNIKAGDSVIDASGQVFLIASVDSANQTVTVSAVLLTLALDANVMHLSGNETVAGIKSFSDETFIKSLNFTNEVPSQSSSSSSTMPIIATITYGDSSPSVQARLNLRVTAEGVKSLYPDESGVYSLGLISRIWSNFYSAHAYLRGQQQNDEYSGNARTNLTLLANRDTVGTSGCLIDTFRENTAQGTGGHIIGFGIKEDSVRYEGCRFSWLWDNNLNGYRFTFRPTLQGANQAVEHNLGTSNDKWDTINGLSPSSLSMPDTSNSIDISGYITDLTGSVNTYTALVDGYVSIRITGTAMRMAVSNGVESSCQRSSAGAVACFVPVVAGETVSVYAVGTSINNAMFRPCKGNV